MLPKNRSIALPYRIPFRCTSINAHPFIASTYYILYYIIQYNNVLAPVGISHDGFTRSTAEIEEQLARDPPGRTTPRAPGRLLFRRGGNGNRKRAQTDVHARGQRRENPLAKHRTRTHYTHTPHRSRSFPPTASHRRRHRRHRLNTVDGDILPFPTIGRRCRRHFSGLGSRTAGDLYSCRLIPVGEEYAYLPLRRIYLSGCAINFEGFLLCYSSNNYSSFACHV